MMTRKLLRQENQTWQATTWDEGGETAGVAKVRRCEEYGRKRCGAYAKDTESQGKRAARKTVVLAKKFEFRVFFCQTANRFLNLEELVRPGKKHHSALSWELFETGMQPSQPTRRKKTRNGVFLANSGFCSRTETH